MDEVLQNQIFQVKLSELLVQEWLKIGIFLNVEERSLEAIKADYVNFPKQEDKAREMIKKWFSINPNPTFEKLRNAIKNIPNYNLLKEVEDLANKFLNKPLNSPSNTSERNSPSNSGKDNDFPLSEQIIGSVGCLIGNDFEVFGRRLGLSAHVVKNIKANGKTVEACAVDVIDKWIEHNGILTWKQLKNELLLFERKNIVELIEKKFINNP
ncbi:uncharacterized protein LOC136075091 [Hydra vulgaris]|uniref:Uncharacterized protein LOC136075091 n=1 Tax=Hydra vulgaris TaxID=6087 RepID=A0ABM4B3L9_HYDVU